MARSSMPRIMSMARRSPTRSSGVRCSGTSAATADSAISVAIWRASPFPGSFGGPGSPDRHRRRRPGSPDATAETSPQPTILRRRRSQTVPVDRLERRQALRRMRWRMRGAWQWPAFFAFTLADAAVLALLPFYGGGPGGFVPSVLLAGFFNLAAVAVGAPLAGRLLRW